MENGYLLYDEKEYHFTFDNYILEITPKDYDPDLIPLDDIQNLFSSENRELKQEVIRGKTISGENICFFVRSMMSISIGVKTFRITSYIKYSEEDCNFNEILVYSRELNFFYPPANACTFPGPFTGSGEININIKSLDEVKKNFNFNFDNLLVDAEFNIDRKITPRSITPMSLFTTFRLSFDKKVDVDQLRKIYRLIKNLFLFVTYRRNIKIEKLLLNSKQADGKSTEIGQFFIDDDKDSFIEDEESIETRIITLDLIDNKMQALMEALSQERIYLSHIPNNSRERKHYEPARFMSIFAAFEWEFNKLYGGVKPEENADFGEVKSNVLTSIDELIGKSSGRKRRYAKDYHRLIEKSDIGLSTLVTS
jgi:hypothetical protein